MSIRSKETGAPVETARYSQDEFLNKMYDSTVKWLKKGKDAEVIAEVQPQRVDHWTSHEPLPGRSVQLGMEIERAVILKDRDNDYAVVLGRHRQTTYDREDTLGLQFGFAPQPKQESPKLWTPSNPSHENYDPVKLARLLVNQRMGYGSGELYVNDVLRKVDIDFWADHRRYGGQMIRDWPIDRLLTDKGIKNCLAIIERTVERAFL